jgi:hypothetical protein
VLEYLEDLQKGHKFNIRLLNDLANIEKSQQIIRDVCQALGARAINEERRIGSSNVSVLWESKSGFRFSTKMSYLYFFEPTCAGCPLRPVCHEGFYGIRLERRGSDYWVRLCIYKQSPDVLMPWGVFLESELPEQFRKLCEQEQL